MKRYIANRLLQGVVLLCLVATIVFFLGRLTGNPVDLMLPEDATAEDRVSMIKALGLDGPLYEQFLIFVNNALHGDLGTSIRLMPEVPKLVTAVAESGLSTPADLARLRATRCDAVLMGEVFMTAADPAGALAVLAAAARA